MADFQNFAILKPDFNFFLFLTFVLHRLILISIFKQSFLRFFIPYRREVTTSKTWSHSVDDKLMIYFSYFF